MSHPGQVQVQLEVFTRSRQAGHSWIAIDGNIYDVSHWSDHHPGGKLVLSHSTGRDVTAAFAAYHPLWVRKQLPALHFGKLATGTPLPQACSDTDSDTCVQRPPCMAAVPQPNTHPESNLRSADLQKVTISSMRHTSGQSASLGMRHLSAVQAKLEKASLFTTSTMFYMRLTAGCACCLVAAIYLVLHQQIVLGALLLGLFWQQVTSTYISLLLALPPQLTITCLVPSHPAACRA